MKVRHLLLLLFCTAFFQTFGENLPISVFESTLKIGALGEEEFYYAFNEGDQLIINFEEVKGKELKEFEVIEYPSSSKFMDYKTTKIKDKVISIQRTGIYKFRLVNSAVSSRICKLSLQRIPATDAARNFNCTVNWRTRHDTTFTTVNEKYLISRDTTIEDFIPHKIEQVSSSTAMNGKPNKTFFPVTLPAGTVSWSYYIGVGKDAEECFKQAEEKAAKSRAQLNAASNLASAASKVDPSGYSAMAALALKGISYFGVSELPDNVQYYFTEDATNAQLFMAGNQFYLFEKGDGPLCYKKMTAPLKGTFYVLLYNDNIRDHIIVTIRMTAVIVKEEWGIRPVKKYTVASIKEPYMMQ